jgi:putative phage-type endonuclease
MKTIAGLVQGSDQWLAHRRTTRNASDASVMMGSSPSISRRELVRLMANGLEREFSDYVQKFILDRGHEVEPALRRFAEDLIEDELYPVTATTDDGYMGASFDGITLDDTVIFEAKQASEEKFQCIERGEIPPADKWQITQQFAVCESAEVCYYCVGDGTPDGTRFLKIERSQIEADIPRLIAAWRQFDEDVANYAPEPEAAPIPVGRAPEQLPALSVQVTGMVTASNLAEFKANAMAVLGSINRDLKTDEDFANADKTVKWCQGVEERLEATKQQVLGQTADIEAVFRTMDEVKAEARKIRLELDKLVTKQKETRKEEIVQAGAKAVREHYDTLNASLGEHRIQPPHSLVLDIGGAIKGKKSLTSMKDAVDTVVAGFKIAASEQAERVRANVHVLEMEQGSHGVLFPDRVVLCATKTPEDLRNLITARIAQAKAEEERRQQEARERQDREAAEAAAQQNTTGAEASAAAEPVATEPARAAATVAPVGRVGAAPTPAGAKVKLGDINARLAPITITTDGLTQIGFKPVAKERSATLYAESDFPHICHALAKVLEAAQQKKAA